MKLGKLPSIIQKTRFDERGLAKTKGGFLVPAYVASQWGFSGMEQLQEFYGRLKKEAKVLPLCPFTACGEYLDFPRLGKCRTIDEVLKFWDEFNRTVGPVNYGELMPRSKFMVAILDGGHDVDDGVAAEIGYYAAKYEGQRPIIGIRKDFRLAENPAAPINPAVRYFIDQGPYQGSFFSGPDAYDNAIKFMAELSVRIVIMSRPTSQVYKSI